ncbi:MAG: D-ribose pyranase [bacterium]|nr:D-ribose pyranase [bacterium]
MKRGKLLHAELSHAIASMGHGDLMIVCDAGFPIPSSAWRIDLAVTQDIPDLETVLTAVSETFIAEKVSYAAEMIENNPPLLEKVKRLFPASEHAPLPHQQILAEMAAKAKVIVRTGAFDPWGNILLYSGVDAPVWFSKPGLNVPPEYAEIVERMKT